MRSLFVVSLPRSLSTTLYHAAARALQLDEPAWTTAGEVLNRERMRIGRRRGRAPAARFTAREAQPLLFERLADALSCSVETHGFAYKDVVQPFVVAEWLDPAAFCVLKVRRDIAEVAYAMLNRRWHYPSLAAVLHQASPGALIEGLLRAESVLAGLPGATVDYAAALSSHRPLTAALETLYPDVDLAPIGYIDRHFVQQRRRLEERRRSSPLFHELQQAVQAVRASLEHGGDGTVAAARMAPLVLDPLSAQAST